MTRYPVRALLASVLAAALALSPMAATPAVAQDNNQLARLLAGAATVAIIGLAVKEARGNDRSKNYRRAPAEVHPRFQRNLRDGAAFRAAPRARARNAARIVPARCLRQLQTRRGLHRYYDATCLQRSLRHAGALPNQCAVAYGRHRNRTVGYDPRCLAQHGWRRG